MQRVFHVCQTPLLSALYAVTSGDINCIMSRLLQLMQCGGLCPLLPSQRSCGERGEDVTLTLNCSVGTYTLALNCLDCMWVSAPLEQHRAQGEQKNMPKGCSSLGAPGTLCPAASKLGLPSQCISGLVVT